MSTSIEYTRWRGEHIYQFPRFGLLSIPAGAVALGMAQAAIDEILSLAQEKTPTGSRRTLAMRATLHRDLASQEVALRAARNLFYQTIDDAWTSAEHEAENLEQRRRLPLDTSSGQTGLDSDRFKRISSKGHVPHPWTRTPLDLSP